MKKELKIAIVGSGISGLSAAWLLNGNHDVTIFEKNNYLGGHSNTATINYDGTKINVDTGFIVFNHQTYPNLKAFFELLGVDTEKSDMSFGVRAADGLEYSGTNLAGLFVQKSNLLKPKFWRMLADIVKFNKKAIALVEADKINETQTLGEFINKLRLGQYFRHYYLLPMAAAIWSCPVSIMENYPAKTFLRFFYNHGLLTVINQPQWYTVSGGSKEYVKKMTASFAKKIKVGCKIVSARNFGKKIILEDEEGRGYEFDHVIFASHADQTCQIIKDKTLEEEKILGQVKYSKNLAILHRDLSQMPENKKAWASWVYLLGKGEEQVSLTYWMNNLQNISEKYPLFVTLNPGQKIPDQKIFGRYQYEHPIFDATAIKAQKELEKIQGQRNMWFCGAWSGYGFHEDGLKSAMKVASNFNIKAPW